MANRHMPFTTQFWSVYEHLYCSVFGFNRRLVLWHMRVTNVIEIVVALAILYAAYHFFRKQA